MKLLFICTSMEPGRDGVGDYTRLLADACMDVGHECRVLALNDNFLDRAVSETQASLHHEIPVVRLSSHERWDERLAAAQAVAKEFSPDWVSWQIVPYGFHPKGLIPHELSAFRSLGRGRRVHAMLHELWIGLSRGEPFKNRVWGSLQRRRLMHTLNRLSPSVVHTSNPVYQNVLARQGCPSVILPLFGNIPIQDMPTPLPNSAEWVGGIFGTVHPQFPPIPCFDVLTEGARASGRKLRLLGIGRLGEYGEAMFAELNAEYGDQLKAIVVGEKSPEEVSQLLQTLDFGIGTHPWALIGKSGAVAAMLDHGVPVVVPRDDWELRKKPFEVPAMDRLLIKLSEMPPELMAGRIARKQAPAARLPGIAAAFLDSLDAVETSLPFNA